MVLNATILKLLHSYHFLFFLCMFDDDSVLCYEHNELWLQLFTIYLQG